MTVGPEGMIKAMAWEQTKGAIRASVALAGARETHSQEDRNQRTRDFLVFEALAEKFMSEVEDLGLQE